MNAFRSAWIVDGVRTPFGRCGGALAGMRTRVVGSAVADDPRVNPHGGAIALGHSLGASGARPALTARRQLERAGGGCALAAMCIGVGQGIALTLERP